MQDLTLAFVSSAYNEASNLESLCNRCYCAFTALQREFADQFNLSFRFVIADNCSLDDSLLVLERLVKVVPALTALANRANYGPEASAANALSQLGHCDLYVLLCSDLQDPPELVVAMARTLLTRPELDAVLAVKQRSAGGLLTRIARRSYYKVLDYSSRLQVVPSGFHGFGCYRHEVIEEALRYWEMTDLNLRQCISNACQSAVQIDYVQADRQHGRSSYRGAGYWIEAFRSIVSADAAASRVALLISSCGFALATFVAILLLVNFLSGNSGYSRGIPTVMGLVLLSFALQLLMIALLSRQIESLRIGGFRPKVRFQKIGFH